MSNQTHAVAPGAAPAPPGPRTTRVSVREVQEISWRALAVLGFSPGEAATAARALTFTEIQLGSGLELVVSEGMNPPVDARGFELREGQIDFLVSPEDTSLLQIAPLAVDLVAARPVSRAVFAPGLAWNPVVAGCTRRYHGVNASALFTFEVTSGVVSRGTVQNPDGSLAFFDQDLCADIGSINPRVTSGLSSDSHGLLFTQESLRFTGINTPLTHTSSSLTHTYRQALTTGLHIDDRRWRPVFTLAERFLVPEL